MFRLLFVITAFFIFNNALASHIEADAFTAAAREHSVPAKLLYALGMVESGGATYSTDQRPWPWTLNVRGKAKYYKSRKAAWYALKSYLKQGIQSIDVGLMQVNWYYHKDKLESPWKALDPEHNIAVAAHILKQQYHARKRKSWIDAAGRYHSPGHRGRANRYSLKVVKALLRVW